MNKVKRDYCSKNYHPKTWKPWIAKYEGKGPMDNKYTHAECLFCGGVVEGGGTATRENYGFGFLKLFGSLSYKRLQALRDREFALKNRRDNIFMKYWLRSIRKAA